MDAGRFIHASAVRQYDRRLSAEEIARALGGRRTPTGWLCRCPAHADRRPSLAIIERNGKALLHCHADCKQNEVIDALRRRGLWPDAPQRGGTVFRPTSRQEADYLAGTVDRLPPRDPMRSWRNAAPFARGCIADRYLIARGIELTDDEARSLRFAASLWHWPTRSRWPAILARVALATGEDLTTHQTFLEPDGLGKAPLGDKARLFPAGARTAGGGAWLGAADPEREFIVAEGIESTLSAMRIFDCTAGCAALSAGGIRALILPAEARRVRIFADHDALGQGVAAARAAKWRWLAEGRTAAVSLSPTPGFDANDVLRERA